MDRIFRLLKNYKEGNLSEDEIIRELRLDYLENIDNHTKLDIFRKERTGIPEVIFAESKNNDVLLNIIQSFLKKKNRVIISRLKPVQMELIDGFCKGQSDLTVEINNPGRIAIIIKGQKTSEKEESASAEKGGTDESSKTNESGKNKEKTKTGGKVGIITAGTSDIPIAEEARVIVEEMGCEVITSYDVGIAGFHRIFQPLKTMMQNGVDVIIVVAGMEGTLPGVVSALVDVIVIGVPTSTGYGHGAEGEGALTTMLQSCSPGLLVVNIDNGFGAGVSAAIIAQRAHKK